jgi:hypothetical protein
MTGGITGAGRPARTLDTHALCRHATAAASSVIGSATGLPAPPESRTLPCRQGGGVGPQRKSGGIHDAHSVFLSAVGRNAYRGPAEVAR